jgi:hypothetical protein
MVTEVTMQTRHRSIFAAIAAGRFTYLLISMGLLLLLSPFLSGIVWAELATDIIFSALCFSAIFAVNREGPLFIVEAVLAVLVFAFRWWYHATLDPTIALLATATGSVFFVLIAASIIFFVFQAEAVTEDTISGSICGYLAAFEAAMGQLYLTVLVARLVGLYGTVRTIGKSPRDA